MSIRVCLFLLLPVSLLAGELPWSKGVFEAEPADLIAASKDAVGYQDGDSVHILARDLSVEIDKEGRKTLTTALVYKILNQSGVENWGSTSATWTPWYQERPEIRARITNADGTAVELDPEHIVEQGTNQSANMYSDRRTLRAPFPGVVPGAVIEERIIMKDRVPFFPGGAHGVLSVAHVYPIDQVTVSITTPKKSPFTFHLEECQGEPVVTIEGDKRNHRFSWSNQPAAEVPHEVNQPKQIGTYPLVYYSTYKNWRQLARGYGELIDDRLKSDTDLPALPEGVIVPGDARLSAIRLTHWINERVRYTGLELGQAAIVPVLPSEVLERKFGDCKDKSTLLISFLRQAGFKAYIALLRANISRDIVPEVPGMLLFNHAIVYVDDVTDFFIDPTVELNRQGLLGGGARDVHALIARSSTKELVYIPPSSSAENRIVETRRFRFDEGEYADVSETTEYFGEYETVVRDTYQDTSKDEIRENLQEYVTNSYRFGTLSDFSISELGDFRKPFQVQLKIKNCGRGIVGGTEATVGMMFGSLFESVPEIFFEEGEERTHDFIFETPFVREISFEIFPPMGFVPRQLPEKQDKFYGKMRFTREVIEKEDHLLIRYRLDSGPAVIDPETFLATRKALADVSSDGDLLYFDHRGHKALAEEDYAGALAAFRADVASNPKSVRARVILALALVDAGLAEQGRVEARRAVALDPDDDYAHFGLASALEYDLLGRRFRTGYDRQGAIDAFRKAIALDDENLNYQLRLAVVLEHDENGFRYVTGDDLKEAVSLYEKVVVEQPDYLMHLVFCAFWACEFDKVEQLLPRVSDEATRDSLKLTCLAARDGLEAAQAAGARIQTKEARNTAYANAADYLIRLERYDLAVAMLRLAARGNVNAHMLEYRADLLEKVIPPSDPEVIASDPVAFYQHLAIQTGIAKAPDYEALFPLLTEGLIAKHRTPDGREELMMGMNHLYSECSSKNISPRALLRSGLAGQTIHVDGSAELGYRLHVITQGMGSKFEQWVFCAVEDGQLKIAGSIEELSPLGWQIDRYLQQGNQEAAARWVEWIFELKENTLTADPLQGFRAVHYWPTEEAKRPKALKLIAGILMSWGVHAERGMAIIDELEPSLKDWDQRGLRIGAITAAMDLGRKEEALRHLKVLKELYPESETLTTIELAALVQLRMYDEAKRLLDGPFEEMTGLGQSIILTDLKQQGKFEEHLALLEGLRKSGKTDSGFMNDQAWSTLFIEPRHEQALVWAREALAMEKSSWAIIHTVATLYADAGRCEEARQLLQSSYQMKNAVEPDEAEWLVLGLIAEKYGEVEAARTYFQRIEKPEHKDEIIDSSWRLAQLRLQAMAAVD